nr:hypothetical protein CTI12_AA423330 [Tanacetum cinerariifolium]
MSVKPTVALRALLVGGIAAFAKIAGAAKAAGCVKLGAAAAAVTAAAIIIDQLVFVKGDSMGTLKEYITKHNVPNDVPDDAEILSEDDDGETENPKKKKASLEEKSQEM